MERQYHYTETGHGYFRFDLWFGIPFSSRDHETGRFVWDGGFHVGAVNSETQAKKICDALNTAHKPEKGTQ